MDTHPRAPFFAPRDRLPAPLPAPEDLANAGEILKERGPGRRIVRIGSYVVKYGPEISLLEGENMLFLRDALGSCIPEIFALYSDKDAAGETVNYIVMEYIPGENLQNFWKGLGPEDRENIAGQLRTCLDAMRGMPAPAYFGSLGRRRFEEGIFWVPPLDRTEANLQSSGPFASEDEFNTALVRKYLYHRGDPYKAKLYSRLYPSVLRKHRPVFTHGDFHRKNVVVKSDKTVCIVDWESAGWYPEYWEYALASVSAAGWRDDWLDHVPRILDEYPNEYAWMEMMYREIWC